MMDMLPDIIFISVIGVFFGLCGLLVKAMERL